MLYNIRFGILSTVFEPSDDGPLTEIQLVNVVIGIHAFRLDDLGHLIVQCWYVMYELDQVRIITDAGIGVKLREDLTELFCIAVVASEIVGGSIRTVADGEDINQDAIRRRYIVKRCRVATLAVIPLMVTERQIEVLLELRVDVEELGRQVRMHSYQRELTIGELAEVVAHDDRNDVLAQVVVHACIVHE